VPPGNSSKLAEAIRYLLDNKDVRTKFGKAGREWIIKNFSTRLVAKRLCGIYEKMVSG